MVFFEVPEVGIEPTRYCYHWFLRPTRLPNFATQVYSFALILLRGHKYSILITYNFFQRPPIKYLKTKDIQKNII